MNTTIRRLSEKINIEELIIPSAPLKPYTSYKCGGPADFLAIVTNLNEFRAVITWASSKNLPITVLGAGSNILVSDDGVEGVVILTHKLNKFHVRGLLCVAESGLNLDTLINIAIEHNLSGLEPLGGLPGTIGGAVWGNSGTHEITISTFIEWVDYLDHDGNLYRYYPLNETTNYRTSYFKENNYIIYEVALRLHFNKNSSLARLDKEKSRLARLQKGEYDLPSAGCMFKNPPGFFAGRLIEEAGCKTTSLNGAMVSPHHANFIVKTKQETTSRDIYNVSNEVKRLVYENAKIELEREVTLIGRW